VFRPAGIAQLPPSNPPAHTRLHRLVEKPLPVHRRASFSALHLQQENRRAACEQLQCSHGLLITDNPCHLHPRNAGPFIASKPVPPFHPALHLACRTRAKTPDTPSPHRRRAADHQRLRPPQCVPYFRAVVPPKTLECATADGNPIPVSCPSSVAPARGVPMWLISVTGPPRFHLGTTVGRVSARISESRPLAARIPGGAPWSPLVAWATVRQCSGVQPPNPPAVSSTTLDVVSPAPAGPGPPGPRRPAPRSSASLHNPRRFFTLPRRVAQGSVPRLTLT